MQRASATFTTSVTPSTRSRMMRSMPALSVCGRRRTRPAGSDQLDGHDAGRLVDVEQHDVAAVGLEGRADDFDGGFDLGAHGKVIQSAIAVRSMPVITRRPRSSPTRAAGTRSCSWSGRSSLIVGLLALAKRRVDRSRRGESNRRRSAADQPAASQPAPDQRVRTERARSTAPTALQPTDEVVVAAIDVVHAGDHRLALGGEAGDDHRRTGTDVVRPHRRTRQARHTAHHGVVAARCGCRHRAAAVPRRSGSGPGRGSR